MQSQTKRYISYLRVSTQTQELGIESQRDIVTSYIASNGVLLKEYSEIESGKVNARPQLERALQHCRMTKSILLIAKLDRLSRDAAFLIQLQVSDVDFICCDMPQANKFMVGIMALIAQHERELISARTMSALAVLKSQGVKMGGAAHSKSTGFTVHGEKARNNSLVARRAKSRAFLANIKPLLLALLEADTTLTDIVGYLNTNNFTTLRGIRGKWTITQVQRLLKSDY